MRISHCYPEPAAIVWARRGTPSRRSLPAWRSASPSCAGKAGCSVCSRLRQHRLPRPVAKRLPILAAAAATVATTGFYAPLGRFWEWNVTNSPGFVFAGTSVWSGLGSGLASVAGFAMFHPVVTVAVGVAIAAVAEAIRRRSVPDDIDLWLWAASGIAAWAAGLRFFGHYWLQVLPALVLIAVPVVAGWAVRSRTAAIAGVAVPMVAAGCCCSSLVRFTTGPTPTRWPIT